MSYLTGPDDRGKYSITSDYLAMAPPETGTKSSDGTAADQVPGFNPNQSGNL